MDRRKIWFIPAVLVAVGIFLLSTFLAIPIQIEGVSGIDKWEHTFAYIVLAGSFLYAFKQKGSLNQRNSGIIFLVCSIYGMALELVQFYFFSYRYFEWFDALANLAGVMIGFLGFNILFQRKNG